MKRTFFATALAALTTINVPLFAIDEGDPAPPLSIERWVLGEPVLGVGKPGGNIYVIAFWATWAKPATKSLFTLSELQKEFGGSNVVVIAIAAESAKKVAEFVKAHPQRDKLNIRIAVDDDQETTAAYLGAAGRGPLPHAFAVNKEGTVAWQGHPLELKKVLEKIIAGTFKIRKPGEPIPPEPADAELVERLRKAEKEENWKLTLELIDEVVAKYPESNEAHIYLGTKFMILYSRLKDYTAAERVARDLLANHSDKFFALNNLAWTLMTAGEFENLSHRWPEIAHQAARRAFEVTQGRRPEILDTYARSLYLLGYLSEALDVQRQAVIIMRMVIDNASGEISDEEMAEWRVGLGDMEAASKYYEQIIEVRIQVRLQDRPAGP